jgi:hypothetical protein
MHLVNRDTAIDQLPSLLLPPLPDFPLLYLLAIVVSLSLTRAARMETALVLRMTKKPSYVVIASIDDWALWSAILAPGLYPGLSDVVGFVVSVLLAQCPQQAPSGLQSIFGLLDATTLLVMCEFQSALLTMLADLAMTDAAKGSASFCHLCAKAMRPRPAYSAGAYPATTGV